MTTPRDDEVATAAQPASGIPSLVSESLHMVVTEGPDAGKTFALAASSPVRVLLGTSPVCEIRLTDPTVSRRHCALEPVGKRFRIADLGSTNGTFVDGVSIESAFLRGDETVRCGGTALRLEAVRGGARTTPLTNEMRFGRTIGASPVMRRLYPLCHRLAGARVPTLIEGETGTGKEVLAESLHEVGGGTGPYVVFDCAAVSPTLIEAELFGHERGAFTGALRTKPGVFEDASGGTLFIDEIGELDLALQPKLLRAIDRGEFRRVGGRETIRFAARILAATRRDLDREVAAGRFRDDLFHRLAVARIELPPLRERTGDVTLLARCFAEQMGASPGALDAQVLARFEDYRWPGNVRELRNAVARRIAVGDVTLAEIDAAEREPSAAAEPAARPDLEQWIDAMITEGIPYPVARRRVLDEFERHFITTILDAHGGSVVRASEASGIARRYFQLVKARTRS